MYEEIAKNLGMMSVFVLRHVFNEDEINAAYEAFLTDYPYCFDYELPPETKLTAEQLSSLKPMKIELQKSYEIKTIQTAVDSITREVSIEVAKTRTVGKEKTSLLVYSEICCDKTNYTIFSLFICHSKTDFKSLTYLMESLLNHLFKTKTPIREFVSEYPHLVENNLLKVDREAINKNLPKCVLQYDFSHIKNADAKTKELEVSQTSKYIQNCVVSHTLNLSPEKVAKIISYCKTNNLSVQAFFISVLLKTYDELFEKTNANEADTVAFMIPYDTRKLLPNTKQETIGVMAEALYPLFPLNFLSKSVLEMATELTTYVLSVDSMSTPLFNRFRDGIYNGNFTAGMSPFTISLSNMGGFKVLDRVEKQVLSEVSAIGFSGCNRVVCDPNTKALMTHSYLIADGSCNVSMSFPYTVVPQIIPAQVLARFDEIITNII
ncbi:hypothetical protein EIN_073960 [Entamoeba invadens IP1]|uniref:Alcohol acetyltransferase n=1 Tax=Entamoeba invadens IP1 TaxID=370355 RepID=A0A0A1UF36_ENTIV|nr:hypothetical protein EIN_073960 [Entamoeba invadens IP1]ELP92573.1 hypothetical protein EIN_073960 [Entamoeba invadens IP1]|eukprot:XP_004259344.1 hypothetical protein EIN_073960 [Entamoeba invadens IP1]